MNRVCKICGCDINALHGNAETCIKHQKKTNKRTIVYREDTISMKRSEFEKLNKQSKLYKAITLASTLRYPICYKDGKWLVRANKVNVDILDWYEIEIAIGVKKCVNCYQCNDFKGICVLYGVPNTEVE
jgi:uncharacterized Fe-S center protein